MALKSSDYRVLKTPRSKSTLMVDKNTVDSKYKLMNTLNKIIFP